MPSLIDLTGNKYARLIVISLAKDRSFNGSTRWLCICECGNETIVRADQLKDGNVKSCGCYATEVFNRLRKPDEDCAFNQRVNSYKQMAKLRNLVFELTDEQLKSLFANNCHYCGAEPSNVAKVVKRTFICNGIDRKDNGKGYTLDNVVTCCWSCNKRKKTQSYEQFTGVDI